MKKILSLILVMIVAFQAPIQSKSMHVQSQSMGPKRFFQCLFMPKKVKCSAPELKKARGWLLGASVVTIAAIATALGIVLTNQQIKKWQREELRKDDELQFKSQLIFNIQNQIDNQLSQQNLPIISEYIKYNLSKLSDRDIAIISFDKLLDTVVTNLNWVGQKEKIKLIDIFQNLENRGYPVNKDQYRKLLGHQPRFL